jgi:hypothetical protein
MTGGVHVPGVHLQQGEISLVRSDTNEPHFVAGGGMDQLCRVTGVCADIASRGELRLAASKPTPPSQDQPYRRSSFDSGIPSPTSRIAS